MAVSEDATSPFGRTALSVAMLPWLPKAAAGIAGGRHREIFTRIPRLQPQHWSQGAIEE